MTAVETVERVLGAGLLIPELTIVPPRGATEDEIREEVAVLRKSLCTDHLAILRHWNGIALDVLRLFGCGAATGRLGSLKDFQLAAALRSTGGIVVGTDPSGYLYVQTADQLIYSFDSDGGSVKLLAKNFDDFIDRLVFGADAGEFAGPEWLRELRESGVIP
jgi:hypothetical protein